MQQPPTRSAHRYPVSGAGLGLRRGLIPELLEHGTAGIDFFELAPENWIGVGGAMGRDLRLFTERHPFVAHGLSLSLGGPQPLDEALLARVRQFLDEHDIRAYTEHLSYCTDDGHLYDLMPIPFTVEAVHHVADRIRRAQQILERPIAIENVSYYAAPGAEMPEIEFVTAVLEEADCGLLLDVNNIFVNAVNHGYDPLTFLKALPLDRVWYIHTAGHHAEAADLRVDTHGSEVCNDVWSLLESAYRLCGPIPTLLERDFNFPPLDELLGEIRQIHEIQARHGTPDARAAGG